MECKFCQEVTHPTCVTDFGVDGLICMSLPNLWECPKCIKCRESEPKPDPEESPAKLMKVESKEDKKQPISSGGDANLSSAGYQLFSVKGKASQPKYELRTQLAEQILAASNRDVKKAKFVFRPPAVMEETGPLFSMSLEQLLKQNAVMLPVFQRLSTADLPACALVCKAWSGIVQDPSLWSHVSFQGRKITSRILSLIVQRQPLQLSLDFCTVSKAQLSWLLPRIPQTRSLSMRGIDFGSCIIALASVNTPILTWLDLSFVPGLGDGALFKILSSPRDSRPGKTSNPLIRAL